MTILAILALVTAATFFVLFMKYKQAADECGRALDEHATKLQATKTRLDQALRHTVPEAESKAAWAAFEQESKELDRKLAQQRAVVQREMARLGLELAGVQSQADLVELGFRHRTFTYEDPKSYQDAIRQVENQQSAMLKSGAAAKCTISWTINGSEKAAEAMMKKLMKLALRTFNADADAAIARVKWNNLRSMEDRIQKCEETIEKTLDKWGIVIDDRYRDLKLKELKLTYEQAEVEYKQREEQRELREQMREEEKARREAERAKAEAEREERRLEQALAKAKQEMDAARTADQSKYLIRIRELELQLQQAGDARIRAISMAQLTKMGHIYIISNIGSFGEDVYKIGMTRRLDPMDRIWELSDASVPFDFDVHALIKCEDAPALEAKLHGVLADRRINAINERKEFFRVSVAEIQAIVQREGHDVQLSLLAEAREYRETQATKPARVDVGTRRSNSVVAWEVGTRTEGGQ